MQDTKSILNIAYPEVEKKIKNNLSKYKSYLSRFINNRSTLLYSNMPSQQIYFSQTDVDDFFKSTGIDIGIIKQAIQGTYYYSIANFNPRYAKDECTVAMLCIIRYFGLKNMKKELELAMINMAFSGKYYPSIWYGSFPVSAPNEHIMEYIVTNVLTNKFDIVREKNVIGAVRSITNTWYSSYIQRYKEFHDDDCVYLIQQLHNRLRSFMSNIAEVYYDYNANKDLYITYDSDDVSDDNQLEEITKYVMEDWYNYDNYDYKNMLVAPEKSLFGMSIYDDENWKNHYIVFSIENGEIKPVLDYFLEDYSDVSKDEKIQGYEFYEGDTVYYDDDVFAYDYDEYSYRAVYAGNYLYIVINIF